MSTQRQIDTHDAPEAVEPGALVAELVAQLAEIATGMCDYADMAQALVAELQRALAERETADAAESAAAAGPVLLGDDVFEVAVLKAQAAGMSVRDYLRAAVLTEDGADGSASGAAEARARAARRDATRLHAETAAVAAQLQQAAKRAERLRREAEEIVRLDGSI